MREAAGMSGTSAAFWKHERCIVLSLQPVSTSSGAMTVSEMPRQEEVYYCDPGAVEVSVLA